MASPKSEEFSGRISEQERRQVKRVCGEILHKGVDVGDLLNLPPHIIEGLTAKLGWSPSSRDVISAAIASYLPELIEQLNRLGFQPPADRHQRPRPFDREAWEMLEAGEARTSLPKIQLLRAVLVRLAREGGRTIDVGAAAAAMAASGGDGAE